MDLTELHVTIIGSPSPILLHQLQRAASRCRSLRQTRPGGPEAVAEGVEFPGDHQAFGFQRIAGPGRA